MMKKIPLLAMALALISGSALAADLPYRKAPPPYAPPPFLTWTGFYTGLNAGGVWDADSNVRTTAMVPTTAAAMGFMAANNARASSGGFIGGGQIGYNWQVSPMFVVGLETDIQGVAGDEASARRKSLTPIAAAAGNFALSNVNVRRSLDYLGTVRGRLGFLLTPTVLVYGTGGFAYGGVSTQTNADFMNVQTAAAALAVNSAFLGARRVETTRPGWTAGGGVEWMFLPNWSAKAEYQFFDLGSVHNNFTAVRTIPAAAPLFIAAARSSTRFDGNIVRAGINYHFNLGGFVPAFAKY